MPAYSRTDARDWAREKLVGAVNCTIPSFSGDLRTINEAAIRHDVRLAKEHGFIGTLGVSEVSITLPEYLDFLRICKDEAGQDFHLVHHASWSNLEQNIEAAAGAERAGADLALLSYPPNFYPESEQDIYDYTKAVCDATSLGIILFPMFLWGFSGRIHPSDIPARLIRRLIDDIPNLAVIKAEGGAPSIMGAIECHRLFGNEVVISVPIEGDLIPLSQLMPIQLSATSDHEYYGPMIPRVMKLLHEGKHDEATEIYWRLHPARKIKSGLAPAMHGGFFLNRQAWKFQGWLQGYNGGPLRMPTQRIHDHQMAALRKGLLDAGLAPSMDPFREFFTGRNRSLAPGDNVYRASGCPRAVFGHLVARRGPMRRAGLTAWWLPGAPWGGGLPLCDHSCRVIPGSRPGWPCRVLRGGTVPVRAAPGPVALAASPDHQRRSVSGPVPRTGPPRRTAR